MARLKPGPDGATRTRSTFVDSAGLPAALPVFWWTSEAAQWPAQNESAVQSRVGNGLKW